MSFKITYLQSKQWVDDPWLITPYTTKSLSTISATKRCKNCDRVKFSVEFPNCDLFIDHKLPCCNTCWRKRDNSLSIEIVNEYDLKKRCKKCDTMKLLGNFAHRKPYNDLYNICRECNRNPRWE